MADEPLHVLFISSWFPSKLKPFSGNFIERHAWAIGKKHKVSVIHVEAIPKDWPHPDYERLFKKGVDYHIYYFRRRTAPLVGRIINHQTRYRIYKRAFQEITINSGPIDIIHSNISYPVGHVAYRLSKTFKLPYIISEHHTVFNKWRETNGTPLHRRMSVQAFRNAYAITAVSNDLLNSIGSFATTSIRKRIPNIVYPYPMSSESRNYFIHVSTLKDDHKNVSGILKAFEIFHHKHPEIRLLVVGGHSPEVVDYYRREAPTGVEFLGPVSHEEVMNHLRKSAGLILFSRYETFSVVVAEAISVGIPVITTVCGGPEEYVTPKMGIITPQEDIDALAQNMERLLSFDRSWKEENRMKLLEEFGEDNVSNLFTDIYQRVLTDQAR